MAEPPNPDSPDADAPDADSEKSAAPQADPHAADGPAASGGGGAEWIDLLNPTESDSEAAQTQCGRRIPTRDELSEVESSSRHYVDGDAFYLSLPMIVRAGKDHSQMTPVGFIVTADRLVTIRFEKLPAFEAAHTALKARPAPSGFAAFTEVVEAIVDQEADILERLGDDLETLNQQVFSDNDRRRPTKEMRDILRRLGRGGGKLGKLRHSLATLGRIVAFVVDHADDLDKGLVGRLNAVRDDVDSLSHFQEALTNKSQFLLDAALGFINIDQNDVIKVLTVVSVVGVPPTLVASVYGMNFKAMPELNWTYGYPYAIALMLITTAVPLIWFKAKKWF